MLLLFLELVFMSEWWSGTKLSLYIKKDEYDKYYGKEHGYLIMNHSYEVDWLMGWHFCDGIQVLGVSKFFSFHYSIAEKSTTLVSMQMVTRKKKIHLPLSISLIDIDIHIEMYTYVSEGTSLSKMQ